MCSKIWEESKLKVYLVWKLSYECDDLEYIFKNKQDAEQYIIEKQGHLDMTKTGYVIEDWEVRGMP